MVRTRTLAVLLAVLIPAALVAAPVPVGGKAADITELPVAANAMLVVQLNGLERTKDRIVKMLQGVDENTAKEAGKQFDEMLKGLLEGRDLAGLDGQGRAFVAVGPLAEVASEEGPFAFLLPVKDYKTFQGKFLTDGERKSFQKGKGGVDEVELAASGNALYLVDTGTGYVVVSPNKDTAEAYAGKYEKLTAKKMGTLADAFLSADVGVFLNLARVNEEYAGPIAQGRVAVGQLFQLVGGQLDPAQIEVAKSMIDGLFQVVEDGTGLVIAVEARPEGAGVRVEGAFTAGSESDKVLAAETPTGLKGLADLPKGMTSYSASNWGKGIGGIQRKLGTEFNPDDDGAGRAIEKWIELTAGGGESVSMSGSGLATLTAAAVKDPQKAADAKLAVFQALGEGSRYSNLALKAKPKAAKDAQKHAGFTLHSATVEVDYEASVQKGLEGDQREAAIEAMKKLVPEKQTIYFGTDGKRFVQVSGKDWDEAKGLLDQFASPKAKASDDPAFAATRKQLPAEAGYVLLSDAGSLIGTLAEYAGGLAGAIPGGPGADFPKFGKVKGDPAYMGVAVTAKKQSVRFDLFVPTTAVKAVMKAAEEGAKEKKE
jgi:hypothetical protein